MCGIFGFCFNEMGATHEDILDDVLKMAVHSQVRGTDACGAYIVNTDGILYWKAPDSVSENLDDLAIFLADNIGPKTVAIIGHTRAATLGDPECNDNNHPILDEHIIGVHNGVIRNHAKLDAKYTKCAEVDSSAIMALLRSKTMDHDLGLKTLTKNLKELEGPFAIAVADARSTDKVYLARNTNPVNFTRNLDKGYLAFASTAEIVKNALGDVETFSMPANTAVRVDSKAVNGKLVYKPLAIMPTPSVMTSGYKPLRRASIDTRSYIPSWLRSTGIYDEEALPEYNDRGKPSVGDEIKCSKCGQYQMYAYTSQGGGIVVHECIKNPDM